MSSFRREMPLLPMRTADVGAPPRGTPESQSRVASLDDVIQRLSDLESRVASLETAPRAAASLETAPRAAAPGDILVIRHVRDIDPLGVFESLKIPRDRLVVEGGPESVQYPVVVLCARLSTRGGFSQSSEGFVEAARDALSRVKDQGLLLFLVPRRNDFSEPKARSNLMQIVNLEGKPEVGFCAVWEKRPSEDALNPEKQIENERTYTQVLKSIETALFFTGGMPL